MTQRLTRAERRRLMRKEGRSSTWEKQPSPKESGAKGIDWFSQLDKAWRNDKYAVMARTINTAWGVVDHVCIRNITGTDITWKEKQKIKNELWGPEYTAIEVFPPESELVDAANMYHLWIFKGYKLPFGL